MARHRRIVLAALLIILIAGCGRNLPARVLPPAAGRAEIGVAYGVVISCPIPIELGETWWVFRVDDDPWPPPMDDPPWPFSMWATVGSPHEVPGVVTLVSPTEAVFRADSDGSEFRLSSHDENPTPGVACL
jgi:hypothetical protein